MEQKEYCNKCNKDFKNGPQQHQQIVKKKKKPHRDLEMNMKFYLSCSNIEMGNMGKSENIREYITFIIYMAITYTLIFTVF